MNAAPRGGGPPSQVLLARLTRHRRGMVAAAAGLLVLMALLGAYAAHRGALPGEHALYDHPLHAPFAPTAAADLEVVLVGLAAPVVAIALVAMLAAMLVEVGDGAGAALVVAASAVTALGALLKALFGRHPLQHLAPVAHFPSGHVAFVSAVLGMAALLALARRRPIAAACCALPIVGIGPAVLLGGGHVATDVAGGYLLAAAWLLLVLAAASRLLATRPAASPCR